MNRSLAISLHQPYASLVGTKKYETRHWRTWLKGDLFICAAKIKTQSYDDFFQTFHWYHQDEYHKALPRYKDLPFGAVVSVVELVDCHLMVSRKFVLTVLRLHGFKFLGLLLTVMPIRIIELMPQIEIDCGFWQPGRYAWQFENIRKLTNPVPIKGQQGIWTPSKQLCDEVYQQL